MTGVMRHNCVIESIRCLAKTHVAVDSDSKETWLLLLVSFESVSAMILAWQFVQSNIKIAAAHYFN